MSDNVISIILGGGKGTRLYPLTKERSKPAVPFGGKYRLVDIPISNCINADFKRIYILTQFNSASLHIHISRTYNFDSFSNGFVEILAAEQTPEHDSWYEGTADAVRKNLIHFRPQKPSHYIILAGDQLYRMDLRDFYEQHLKSGAEVTVAATAVTREDAAGYGIMKVDKKGRISDFLEKPPLSQDVSDYLIPETLNLSEEARNRGKTYLASMGIYIFNAEAMETALDNSLTDFGKEIIPSLLKKLKIHGYIFNGYWEDIGTIKSFYEANIMLADVNPNFNFYEEKAPIYTHKRHLPASKINFCTIAQSMTADGCIITNAAINRSIVGIRTIIESGSNLDGVVCMGADYYESPEQKKKNEEQGIPNIGIGFGTAVRRAIIDKNARIGNNCRVGVDNIYRTDGDYGSYHIIDGIIVIAKNSIIPHGTVI